MTHTKSLFMPYGFVREDIGDDVRFTIKGLNHMLAVTHYDLLSLLVKLIINNLNPSDESLIRCYEVIQYELDSRVTRQGEIKFNY